MRCGASPTRRRRRDSRRGLSGFLVPVRVLREGTSLGIVHRGDVAHVLLVELEPGQVEIGALTIAVHRLRDRHVAELQVPAQDSRDGGTSCLAAMRTIVGSLSIWLARPNGLQASVMMPCA